MAIPIPTSSSSAGSAAATGATQLTAKAFFFPDPEYLLQFPFPIPHPVLICRYNPKSLKISGGGEWKEFKATKTEKTPPKTFSNPKARKMEGLELLVDMFELPYGNVNWELRALEDWCQPRKHLLYTVNKQVSAVHLRFQWGEMQYFKCFISSYDITYEMFSKSGAPLRAKVNLTLEEALSTVPGQNPTSGGEGGERSYVTRSGDSLHSIAYHHYHNPKYWRGLAAFNGIDDPLRLPTGAVVNLPDATTVADLS
jgi:nucleoid-associated protein YgaU